MSIFKTFPRTFWVANTIELFERWAWYGFFMLFANYLTESSDLRGLEFSQTQKGMIMGIGTGILYFLPVITGSIADKYGYKRMLSIAFVIYTSAFLLLPHFHSFTGVFIMYLYLAIGAALFKPIISATVAKTTNDKNSSIGFGIFYMMVNLGAFLGPMLSLLFRSSVFYISAGMIALNFLLLFFYQEPDRKESTESLKETIISILRNIVIVLKDLKFVVFLVIVSGFWVMYNQLFFTLPVFISQWVDSSNMYQFFEINIPFLANNYGVDGQMEAEFITNFDALFIIIFQIAVSAIVMRKKPLNTMIAGIIVASIGMALTLFTQNVIFILIAMFVFSIGEMSASPKITEYIGKIASTDKKALYMGYSFLPLFIGNIGAGFISGNVYQKMSDKYEFAKQFATEKNLDINLELTNNQLFQSIAHQANMSEQELTNTLWNIYHPSSIWIVILSIGLASAFSLIVYNWWISKKQIKQTQ